MNKKYFYFLLLLPLLISCNNKLDVNAAWSDITVVYGLLNQNDSIHDLRITKAFLGPGDAMQFAKIADSSNYPSLLNVRLEEWDISGFDSTLKNTWSFDTLSIANKDTGIFYYPVQKVYRTIHKLNANYTYKLFITQPKSGKTVTSRTAMISALSIKTPRIGNKAAILPQTLIPLEFSSSKNGRRYQLVLRFNYTESSISDTSQHSSKFVDWQVFTDVLSNTLDGGETIGPAYLGDGLYSAIKSKVAVDPTVIRHATYVDYILSVGTDDLNTYINVTAPSNTIVQERPDFTNIGNGIGLFTSIYDNTKDSPRHLPVGPVMIDSLRSNHNTYNLGF